MRKVAVAATLGALLAVQSDPYVGVATEPSSAIWAESVVDGSSPGGNPLFHFRAPIRRGPSDVERGEFASYLLDHLAVEICEAGEGPCGEEPLTVFTADGPEGLRLGVDPGQRSFVALWRPAPSQVGPSRRYRIQVRAGPVVLGHAEVYARGRRPEQFASVSLDGSEPASEAIPIAFTVEDGALAVAGAGLVDAEGGVIASPDGVALSIPRNALSRPQIIAVSRSDGAPGTPTLGDFAPTAVSIAPAGLTFEEPARVTVSTGSQGSEGGSGEQPLVLHVRAGGVADVLEPTAVGGPDNVSFTVRSSGRIGFFFPHNAPEGWSTFGFRWGLSTLKWYVEPPAQGVPSWLYEVYPPELFQRWASRTSRLRFEQTFSRAEAQIVFEEAGTAAELDTESCLLGILSRESRACFDTGSGPFENVLDGTDVVVVRIASDAVASLDEAEAVLMREIGHSLGIAPAHGWDPSQADDVGPVVMNGDGHLTGALHPWDVAAVQHLYGAPASFEVLEYVDFSDFSVRDGTFVYAGASGREFVFSGLGARALESFEPRMDYLNLPGDVLAAELPPGVAVGPVIGGDGRPDLPLMAGGFRTQISYSFSRLADARILTVLGYDEEWNDYLAFPVLRIHKSGAITAGPYDPSGPRRVVGYYRAGKPFRVRVDVDLDTSSFQIFIDKDMDGFSDESGTRLTWDAADTALLLVSAEVWNQDAAPLRVAWDDFLMEKR